MTCFSQVLRQQHSINTYFDGSHCDRRLKSVPGLTIILLTFVSFFIMVLRIIIISQNNNTNNRDTKTYIDLILILITTLQYYQRTIKQLQKY